MVEGESYFLHFFSPFSSIFIFIPNAFHHKYHPGQSKFNINIHCSCFQVMHQSLPASHSLYLSLSFFSHSLSLSLSLSLHKEDRNRIRNPVRHNRGPIPLGHIDGYSILSWSPVSILAIFWRGDLPPRIPNSPSPSEKHPKHKRTCKNASNLHPLPMCGSSPEHRV